MAGSTQISNGAGVVSAPQQQRTVLPSERDLWIFRDGMQTVSGPRFLEELRARIARIGSELGAALDVLIHAGQLESALADAGNAFAGQSAALTEEMAGCFYSGADVKASALRLIDTIESPESIRMAPPEGFTYYALHPLDFARLADRIPPSWDNCAIVGIRSIGTTLSAVLAVALRHQGRRVSRISVRPHGHPYSRVTEFDHEQKHWIRDQPPKTHFLIVDEGPGRSGSTFLSVAEALLGAGIARNRILLLGSRQADPDSLCASNAAGRWRQFEFLSTSPPVNSRFDGCMYIGGGDWRDQFLSTDTLWPESWTQMERLKFLAPDHQTIFKFEGMGPMGAEARKRAFTLGQAGFSPAPTEFGDGFLAYPRVKGRCLSQHDLSAPVLEHIARYCAYRASAFSRRPASHLELRQMLEFNVHQELCVELRLDDDDLLTHSPILADGRMQPHEWVFSDRGGIMKIDGISHGDNHFFPGPCHIAWDLAGAIIEWQLVPQAAGYLIEKFLAFSGEKALPRLEPYLLCYCVFGLGFCKMAISAQPEPNEKSRLTSAYLRYRRRAEELLPMLSTH